MLGFSVLGCLGSFTVGSICRAFRGNRAQDFEQTGCIHTGSLLCDPKIPKTLNPGMLSGRVCRQTDLKPEPSTQQKGRSKCQTCSDIAM